MALIQNSDQSSINPFASGGSAPSTTIHMTSNSTSSLPYVRSSKKNAEKNKQTELSVRLNNNQGSITDAFMLKLSHRLTLRRKLHKRLRLLSDIMCFVAILGIVLMIIENELRFKRIEDKDTVAAWSIRLTITVSTAILIVLILIYHRLDLSLYCIDHSFNDWRVGLTNKRIFQIVLEVVICAVHPVVRSFPNYEQIIIETSDSTSTEPTPYPYSHVDIDVALGIPMFARLYLLCRVILYHSHLFHDAASQSIGYLSTVSFDFLFVIKTYLKRWPERCLLIWCTLIFFVGGWSFRACEYEPTHEHAPLTDAMWLFVPIFGTVGYSNLAAATHCGRVTRKLMLSRWENYVHTFVLNTELVKEHKNQAANVIKFAWKLWFWKKRNTPLSSMRYLQMQRKLFRSIGIIHQIKRKQLCLTDDIIDLTDIMTIQRSTGVNTNETIQDLTELELKMDKIQEQLANLNYALNNSKDVVYFSL
ncbi:unnamed protein product [Rotaria sp. Silwood2]|nr:unnamed protein product [Rotaria sp. Silwood2]CAF3435605.1 unnamed protein product [Rotaria sp. Silwood2]CAF4434482.1 unnamed protein product [Rotaria sp. Silwood2]CAF4509199.1 unnamed protein product [Rotaria sp. Silwood2]